MADCAIGHASISAIDSKLRGCTRCLIPRCSGGTHYGPLAVGRAYAEVIRSEGESFATEAGLQGTSPP